MSSIAGIRQRRGHAPARGQIIVIAAFGMIALIAFSALILEGGNAYAQQRVVQNGADAAANAGAVTLAQGLGGPPKSDAQVLDAVTDSASANSITSFEARYTDVKGVDLGANVGGGSIPAGAQGVNVAGTRSFPTFLGRAIGFNSFDASADATAVTGRLVGGRFLPVVFPISIVDCDTNGSLGSVTADNWQLAQPDGNDAGDEPDGIEYIVPLCKTNSGSFQILDFDPALKCGEEVANIPYTEWETLPVDVDSDNGNNCAKPIAEYVNANLQGATVMIPICDNTVGTDPCGTEGGSHASYRITRIAAFYIDYMSHENGGKNEACESHTSASGQSLVTIAGNGSSSCLAGWFVRYIDAGPVAAGTVSNTDAIGVQLIK